MIAPQDFPGLVARIHAMRDAQAKPEEIRTNLSGYAHAHADDSEIVKLKVEMPDIEAGFDALISGSCEDYFNKHPSMKAAIRSELSSQSNSASVADESVQAVLDRAGFVELSAPLLQLEQLLNVFAALTSDASPTRCAALREEAIRRLKAAGVRAPAQAVAAALRQCKLPTQEKQGRAFEVADPLPWAETVEGIALLDQVVGVVRKYVILPTFGAEAAALWVLHTYSARTASDWSPRLAITGPTKRCGKSRLLEVLDGLVFRPLVTQNISPAAMFRIIERDGPTLLIDEGDAFLRENEDMRGLLNAGQRRGGQVLRVVGEDHEPRAFDVFAPVAIAAIGELAETVRDRAIAIPMRRKAPGEVVTRLRLSPYRNEVEPLRRKLMRWTADHADELQRSEPKLPVELDDRAADGWEPLLAIADAVSGPWPARAREAAVALSADRAAADDNVGVLLLGDLRDLFAARGEERLTSEEIVQHLGRMEERPWSEWGQHRKPILPVGVARLLKPFSITPKNLKLPDQRVLKGYARSEFEDAWRRYCCAPSRYPLPLPEAPGETASATTPASSGSDCTGAPREGSGVAAASMTYWEMNGSAVFDFGEEPSP